MTPRSGAELVAELKGLRRGRGVAEPGLASRLGPLVRGLFHVRADEDGEAVLAKVAGGLEGSVNDLPAHQRLAVTAAFGLGSERGGTYRERVARLAVRESVSERTVRRRVDSGTGALAELLRTRHVDEPRLRWRTERLELVVVLDHTGLEVLEFRTAIAVADGLTGLELLDDVLVASRGALLAAPPQVLHGGELLVAPVSPLIRSDFVLHLPRTLNRGAPHDFAVRSRPATASARNLVCVPRHRGVLLDLKVLFPRGMRPRHVVRLADVAPDDVVTTEVLGLPAAPAGPGSAGVLDLPGASLVEVDPVGGVHLRFGDPAPGMASGLCWPSA